MPAYKLMGGMFESASTAGSARGPKPTRETICQPTKEAMPEAKCHRF